MTSHRRLRRTALLVATAAAALLAGCSSDDTTAPPADDSAPVVATTDAPVTTTLPPIDGELRVRPILAVLPVEGFDLNPIGGNAPTDTVVAPENATGLAYELGPSVLDQDDVVQATPGLSDGQWGVTVLITEEATQGLRAVAADCLVAAPTCPRGQLAITVDGFVVATPVVQSDTLGPELVIVGSLTEAESQQLAEALGGAA